MNELIERIYRTGQVEDAAGNTRAHVSAVSFEAGALLYDVIRAARPTRTLEVGMAYGLSTLFMCQAHQDNGGGHHTAIDPLEHEEFSGIGLLNVERAKLSELLRFYESPSEQLLPQLCAQQEQFGFALIDGSHLFDNALVDFFYVDRLLAVGGYLAIDDLWMPAVRKVASFVLRNRRYELVRPLSPRRVSPRMWVMRAGRRILQNPFGPDWRLKLVPENVALFKKMDGDGRRWDFHRSF